MKNLQGIFVYKTFISSRSFSCWSWFLIPSSELWIYNPVHEKCLFFLKSRVPFFIGCCSPAFPPADRRIGIRTIRFRRQSFIILNTVKNPQPKHNWTSDKTTNLSHCNDAKDSSLRSEWQRVIVLVGIFNPVHEKRPVMTQAFSYTLKPHRF